MLKLIPCITLLLLMFTSACSKAPETLVSDGYDEAAIDTAIERARSEVDEFAVKAPIKDENGTEHFWISDVRLEKGEFVGKIGNEPGIVENVKIGQEWRIKKTEISDWMFMRGEKIHGGYTIDPLLPTMDKARAAALRRNLVR